MFQEFRTQNWTLSYLITVLFLFVFMYMLYFCMLFDNCVISYLGSYVVLVTLYFKTVS